MPAPGQPVFLPRKRSTGTHALINLSQAMGLLFFCQVLCGRLGDCVGFCGRPAFGKGIAWPQTWGCAMDERREAEAQKSRRLVLILAFVLIWELLGRPFLAHLCPTHEMPPSLIGELLDLGFLQGLGL